MGDWSRETTCFSEVAAIAIGGIGISSIDELDFTQVGEDVLISSAGNDLAIFLGVRATELEANGTFLFA